MWDREAELGLNLLGVTPQNFPEKAVSPNFINKGKTVAVTTMLNKLWFKDCGLLFFHLIVPRGAV